MPTEEKVIITGNPNGQVMIHLGQKILPGVKYTMERKVAESYYPHILIVEKAVQNVEVPKPEKREVPEDIIRQNVAGAEAGRMERGGQKRSGQSFSSK